MFDNKWRMLQLFAGEGAGDGGGEGAATGDVSADAGQQRLRELGVPEDKIRKRARRAPVTLPEGAVRTATAAQPRQEQQTEEQAAAADTPAEEKQTEQKAKPSFDELLKDPDYNRDMQNIVKAQLKSANVAEESLAKLIPALEVLARRHKMDPEKLDYEALAKAICDDNAYYEEKALELGTSVDIAKKLDQQERETARQQRQQALSLEQQKIQNHFRGLEQQGEALKRVFPDFDLRAELQNPAFARMTSPNVGVSVEDAYYAVHRKEIQAASMQVTAQKTAQKLSNSIQAGKSRAYDSGTSGQAPSVTTFDYTKASRAERAELKRRIREAAARGEKLYPGR